MSSISVDKRLAAGMNFTGVALKGRTEGSLEILYPVSHFERRIGFPRNWPGIILPMGWMFLHSRPLLLVEAWEKRFSWITEGLGRILLTVGGLGLTLETVILSGGNLGWSILKEEVEGEF